MPKKVCIVLVDRANYGRMKPVMECLRDDPRFEMTVVCAGAMLLERFGRSVDVVRADGFMVDHEIYCEVEGATPLTMVTSLSQALAQFASVFHGMDTDFIIVIGDRYQAMGAAIAAAYQNKCLVHVQGGEVSGSIDESTRHAITKLAHYHFPATERAGRYIEQMGERPETVFVLGCPGVDVVMSAPEGLPVADALFAGVGQPIDFSRDFLLAVFHPVTTAFDTAEGQMQQLLLALKTLAMPTVMVWPNIDAGSGRSSKVIRQFREMHQDSFPFHVYKNIPPDLYIPLLRSAQCLVGNSSSFVRDASFLGTPVVLVGNRQTGRECSEAVRLVDVDHGAIVDAIRRQCAHGRYVPSTLYGAPGAAQRITDKLAELEPYSQKTLAYLQ